MSTAHHQQPPPRSLRTTRVAANTARPLQPQTIQTQSQQRPLSGSSGKHTPTQQTFQEATTIPKTATLAGPSSLSLFLRNIRLLDLDLLPDWPGISPDTFAATGNAAAQGQKKRIQCVEWALFRLFSLWDPTETANKLKPFFPPLDQVQSLNLRAALLRSLEQAKKNGVLGRDALLRKTMLDECKGDRLLDLLAVFSSAVLKKVIVDDSADPNHTHHHPALALKLATENRGYKEDKTELSTLILAHKVSLHRTREKRQTVHARFRDFSDLLGVKERGLVRRKEEMRERQEAAEGKGKPNVSENARNEMRRTVRNNWTGDERWMETILSGDAGTASQDGPFGMPFDRVWRRVQQDRLGELEAKNTGLLEQLDGRVRVHKDRLEKWRSYRRDLFGDPAKAAPSPSKKAATRPTKGIDLGFGGHEDIRVGRMSPVKQQLSKAGPRVNKEYRSLLDNLNRELADEGKPNANALSRLRNHRRKVSETLAVPTEEAEGAISELSDLEDDETDNFTTGAPISSFSNKLNGLKRPNLSRPETSYWSPSKESPLKRSATGSGSQTSSHQASPNQSPSPMRHVPINVSTPGQSPTRLPDETAPVQPSPTQQLADEILASMNTASPSPSKRTKPRHTLSLAERTRLSMAPRGSSLFLEDDEPDLQPPPSTTSTPPLSEITTTLTTIPTTDLDDTITPLTEEPEEDLVSRTRKSMAGFEKARQKAQLERRRSQRRSKIPPRKDGSYFPKVDEDEQEEGGALTEDLMMQEDVEAVFRSRPKMRTSPLPSPTRDLDFDY